LFDPIGSSKKALDQIDVPVTEIQNLNSMTADLLIIANIDALDASPDNWQHIKDFANTGGKVLLIHPGQHILSLFPEKIESILDSAGRIANMHVPESDAFIDIKPLELSWWQPYNDKFPTVCKRSYRLKSALPDEKLCTYVEIHNYLSGDRAEKLKEMSGAPLVHFKVGKGTIIASEMELNIGWKDPVAAKVLGNLINMLLKD